MESEGKPAALALLDEPRPSSVGFVPRQRFLWGRVEAAGEGGKELAGKASVKEPASDTPAEVGGQPRHSSPLSEGGEPARDALADLEGMALESAALGEGPAEGGNTDGDALA